MGRAIWPARGAPLPFYWGGLEVFYLVWHFAAKGQVWVLWTSMDKRKCNPAVTLPITTYSIKLRSHKFLSPAAIATSGFSPLLYFDLSHRCLKFWHFFMSWILCKQLRCVFSISLANINFRWYAKPVETSESFSVTIMGFGSGLLIAVICLNLF